MNDKSNKSKLGQLRQNVGLSQKELGDAIGVTEDTIANWENGRRQPRLLPWQLKKLCQTLQIFLVEDIPDEFGPTKSSQG